MEGYRLSPEKKTEDSCQRLVLYSWQYNILLNSDCNYAWYLQNLFCGCQNSVCVVIFARFAVIKTRGLRRICQLTVFSYVLRQAGVKPADSGDCTYK